MSALPIVRPTADTVLLFHPETGEQIELATAPVDDLAFLRDLIRQAEEDQRVAKQELDAELHRRMDRDNTLTLKVPGWEITGKSALTSEWDADQLKDALADLVEAGELSEDAARRALKPVVTLKPAAGELKKLAARFPTVEACRSEVPQARRATVKKGPA